MQLVVRQKGPVCAAVLKIKLALLVIRGGRNMDSLHDSAENIYQQSYFVCTQTSIKPDVGYVGVLSFIFTHQIFVFIFSIIIIFLLRLIRSEDFCSFYYFGDRSTNLLLPPELETRLHERDAHHNSTDHDDDYQRQQRHLCLCSVD